jgi:hypothetical protein
MTTETITRKEACELIRSYIGKDNKNMPTGDDLDRIVHAVNNDMQVRDFMLGLPQYYDTQEVINFLEHMCNESPSGKDVPFFAVVAAIAYEHGDGVQFFKHMGYIMCHGPDYSLAQVLARCAASGFPGTVLTKMRNELAAVVMKACYTDTPDYIITESEDDDGQHISASSDLPTSSKDSGHETSRETESGSTTNTQS